MMSDIHSFEPLWNKWYVDDKPLGEGSFGCVYSAHCTDMGYTRRAAVKHISVPRDENELTAIQEDLGTADEQTVRQYCRDRMNEIYSEFKQMDQLKGHTNIVNCEDSLLLEKTDSPGFDLFIRMELLSSVAKRNLEKPFTRNEVIRLGIDICQALELLEKKKIVHRDIKPQNIFINADGEFKLGDFGTARTISRSATMMSVKGTYAYMAPEIASGAEADFRSDVYSLGLVLYRLMNHNKSPFAEGAMGSSSTADRKAIAVRLGGDTDLPLPAEADEPFGQVILKACAHSPENRFQTARAFRYALESLPMEHTGAAATPLKGAANIPQVSGAAGIPDVNSTIFRPAPINVSGSGAFNSSLSGGVKASSAVVTGAAAPAPQPAQPQQNAPAKDTSASWVMQHRKPVLAAAAAVILLLIGLGAWLGISELQNSNAYSTALTALERNQYDAAIEGFTKLGGYRDASVQAVEAANRRDYAAAEVLFKTGKYSEASAAFAALGNFQDAPERSLEASNEHAYQQAAAQYNAGQYEAAAAAFAALGDYKDASARQRQSLNTQDQETDYRAAIALYDEGKYAEAERAFEALGDYSDAEKWAKTAKTAREDDFNYNRAISLENTGRYEEANALFSALGNYKDAPAHTVSTQNGIDYNMALEYVTTGQYDLAISIFNELARSGYRDAAQQSVLASQTRMAALAREQMDKGNYASAIETFRQLQAAGYPDAAAMLTEAEQMQTYASAGQLHEQGNYQQAHEMFASLGDFRDAADRAEASRQAHRYQQGKDALQNGNYSTALFHFNSLKNYQDASTLAKEAQKGVDYQTAETLLSTRKYTEAYEIFIDLGDYSDAAARAVECLPGVSYEEALVQLENGRFAEALATLQGLAETNPEQFPEAAEKAALAQQGVDFTQASSLLASRKYAEAADMFEALGDYPNAAAKARDARYLQAVELLDDGLVNEALVIFTALGDYPNAAGQVALCQEVLAAIDLYTGEKFAEAIDAFTALEDRFPAAGDWVETCKRGRDNESSYQRALSLENLKQYSQANSIFTRLGDYKDARDHASFTQKGMDFQTATSHLAKGEYDVAIGYLATIQDFPGAPEQLQVAQNRKTIAGAEALMAQGSYSEALEIFTSLGDFENAPDLAAKAQYNIDYQAARQLLASGDYAAALDAFAALGVSPEDDSYAATAQKGVDYLAACTMLEQGEYAAAAAAFDALGSFRDSAAQARSARYQEGQRLIAAGNYVDAAALLDGLGAYEDAATLANNARHEQAKVLLQQGRPDEAMALLQGLEGYDDLTDLTAEAQHGIDYNAAVVQLQRGNTDEAHAAFTALGIDPATDENARQAKLAVDYDAAGVMHRQKHYAEAGAAYAALGDYADAAYQSRVSYYYYADALYDAGKYEESAKQYEALGDHDNAEYLAKRSWMSRADQLMDGGQYAQALEIYEKLGDYNDAAGRAGKAREHIQLETARTLLAEGKYGEVVATLSAVSLSEAAPVRKEAENALTYNAAMDHIAKGELARAQTKLKSISGYRDADAHLAAVQEQLAYAESATGMHAWIYANDTRLLETPDDAANVIATLPASAVVYIDAVQYHGGQEWLYVSRLGQWGYLHRSDAVPMTAEQNETHVLESPERTQTHAWVYSDGSLLRNAPRDTSAGTKLSANDVVYVDNQLYRAGHTWHYVMHNNKWGYMRSDELVLMTPEEHQSHYANHAAYHPQIHGWAFSNDVYLYSGVSANSDSIMRLSKSNVLFIDSIRYFNGQTWYYVAVDGMWGYVRGDLVVPMNEQQEQSFNANPTTELIGRHAWLYNDPVYLYDAPVESAVTGMSFAKDSAIPYVQRMRYSYGNVWYDVYINGYTGCLKGSDLVLMDERQNAQYVSTPDAAPMTPVDLYAYVYNSGCFIYEAADESSDALVKLDTSHTVYIASSFHSGTQQWYYVRYGDEVGCMKISDLVPMTPTENENYVLSLLKNAAMGPGMSGYGYINMSEGKAVKLNALPSTSSSRVTNLTHGTLCRILDVVKEHGLVWYHVESDSGKTGYVRDMYFVPVTQEQYETFVTAE